MCDWGSRRVVLTAPAAVNLARLREGAIAARLPDCLITLGEQGVGQGVGDGGHETVVVLGTLLVQRLLVQVLPGPGAHSRTTALLPQPLPGQVAAVLAGKLFPPLGIRSHLSQYIRKVEINNVVYVGKRGAPENLLDGHLVLQVCEAKQKTPLIKLLLGKLRDWDVLGHGWAKQPVTQCRQSRVVLFEP